MGGLSVWHWLVVGVVILLLFGKGRFSDMMGDVAKGLKSFKKGMTEDDETPAKPVAPAQRIEGSTAATAVEPEREARPVDEARP